LTTAITSFIPFIGAHIVWVPICLYLLVTGHILKAAILAAFGILGIGLVDVTGDSTKIEHSPPE